MLDRLRMLFPYIVALALPLAGVIIAVIRYSEGEHDDALRLAAVALLGMSLYALAFV